MMTLVSLRAMSSRDSRRGTALWISEHIGATSCPVQIWNCVPVLRSVKAWPFCAVDDQPIRSGWTATWLNMTSHVLAEDVNSEDRRDAYCAINQNISHLFLAVISLQRSAEEGLDETSTPTIERLKNEKLKIVVLSIALSSVILLIDFRPGLCCCL
jgi:hypothetical protein